jgi:hypothetical protein
MKSAIWVILASSLCLVTSYTGNCEDSTNVLSVTNSAVVTTEQHTNQSDNWHWDQAKADALRDKANRDQNITEMMEYSEMVYQKNLHEPPKNMVFLPNYQAGPLNPPPIRVNFYAIDDRYPTYLLCQYDVDEKNYSQSNEPEWFKAALEQIRSLSPKKFPPIKWVAVIINNRAEWKGVSTIDQAHKVGAIFKAEDVFDSSRDLSQLIAHADMDRHPFKYDTSQPTPGEQQRWMIVERHAATNQTNKVSN